MMTKKSKTAVSILILVGLAGRFWPQPAEQLPDRHSSLRTVPASVEETAEAAQPTPSSIPAAPAPVAGGNARSLPPGDMASITRQMAAAAYWFGERSDMGDHGAGWGAGNEAQGFGAHVNGDGVWLGLRNAEGTAESVELALEGTRGEVRRGDGRQSEQLEIQRDRGVTEWYKNAPEGLEHGFYVSEPVDEIVLPLSLKTTLRPVLVPDGSGVVFFDESRNPALRYEKLMAWDAAGKRLPARMEWAADAGRLSLCVNATGAEFPVTVDPVFATQTGRLAGAGTVFNDRFGEKVALSGDWLAVAAPAHDGTGAVFVYERNRDSGAWQARGKLVPPSSTRVVNVALSAEWMAIAHTVGPSNQSAVQLYKRVDHPLLGIWERRESITRGTADALGAALRFSGTRLFLGAPGSDVFATNAGLAVVWKLNAATDTWAQEGGDLPGAAQVAAGDAYGTSLAVDGNILAVGAPGRTVSSLAGAGSIVMHYRDGATWPFEKRVVADDFLGRRANDRFGTAVALDGSWMMCGSPLHDGSNNDRDAAGLSALHSRNTSGNDEWGARHFATGLTPDSQMSRTIAGFNNVFAVSQYDTALAATVGPVDLWTFNAGEWNRLERLYAADFYTALEFGGSLDIDGEHLVVGAPGENINQGAIYIFRRHQTAGWQPVAQPTVVGNAPGFTIGGQGTALAMEGDRLIVGAPTTSQNVGLAIRPNSGLAYIFERNTGGEDAWRLIRVLAGDDPRSGHRFGASVDIAGDCAVVGAWGADSETGQVHVYLRNQGGTEAWGEAELLVGSTNGARFGEAVACTDRVVVVGAPGESDAEGRVRVYERHRGGVNAFNFALLISNPAPLAVKDGDRFGAALTMDESHLLIGAPDAEGLNASNQLTILRSGRAWIYDRTTTGSWALTDELNAQVFGAEVVNGRLGTSVALAGNRAFVGSPGRNQVLIYQTDETDRTQWPLQEILNPPAGAGSVEFGTAVATDSSTWVAVGAPGFDATNTTPDSGAVFLFNLTDTLPRTWRQQGRLESPAPASGARLGAALATLGRSLAAGAPGGAGATHVFQGQDTGWITSQQVWSDNSADIGRIASHRFVVSDGVLAVVGRDEALGTDATRLSVHFFEHGGEGSNGAWQLVRRSVIPDAAGTDVERFGDLAMDGDTLAIIGFRDSDWINPQGGANVGTTSNSIYVLGRDQGGRDQWGSVRRLNPPGVPDLPVDNETLPPNRTLWSLAVTGDCILAGAMLNDVLIQAIPPLFHYTQGQVQVYCRNTGGANNWGLEQTLNSPDGAEFDRFGWNLAADDQVLAVSMMQADQGATAPFQVAPGAVAIFRRTGTEDNPWTFSRKITPPGGVIGDFFGAEIALDGELLAVLDSNNDGQKLYVFERNNGGGSEWDVVRRINVGTDARGLALHSGRLAYHQERFNGAAFVTSIMVHERNSGGADGWRAVWQSPEVESVSAQSINYDGYVALWGEHLFAGREFSTLSFDTVETFRLSRTAYETWLRAQFTDAVVDQGSLRAGTWGEEADPDRDRVPNVLEAALGTNPEAPNGNPGVTVALRRGFGPLQGDTFVWRWRRAAEDQGVRLRPEWSPNANAWYLSGDGPPGDARVIQLTDLGPDTTGRHLIEATMGVRPGEAFLRLRAWRE